MVYSGLRPMIEPKWVLLRTNSLSAGARAGMLKEQTDIIKTH